jgi:hypothetical protein
MATVKPTITPRDLFWLVLVCAIGCAWWIEGLNARSQHRQLKNAHAQLQQAFQVLKGFGCIVPDEPDLNEEYTFIARHH